MDAGEQEAARAERAGHDQGVEEDEAAALLHKPYLTRGPLRRWFWRFAEGATRFGSDGRGSTGS
jgi:hypothetical protein